MKLLFIVIDDNLHIPCVGLNIEKVDLNLNNTILNLADQSQI